MAYSSSSAPTLPTLEGVIEELSRYNDINETAKNLGCRVKFLIEHVLEGIQILRQHYKNIKFFPREDVYIFDTDGIINLHRFDRSLEFMINGGDSDLTRFLANINPVGLVSLFALADGGKDVFVNKVRSFYDSLENAGKQLTFGKGHTIRTAGANETEFGVLDFIESLGGNLSGVANNDTIVDIDCKLPPSSWITIYTALNNALNDLFASGVCSGIRIFPTIAGTTPEETTALQSAVQQYAERFSQYDFRIEDVPPLGSSNGGYSTKVVGATVIGTTDREVPRHEYLREGQILFVTRPIGDLIPLAEFMVEAYRASHYEKNQQPEKINRKRLNELEELRARILHYLVTPNLEAAKIIANYLPKKGEPFDDTKHITSSIDVSGPGIQTVGWLAQDSRHHVYIDKIVYHHESIPSSPIGADQSAGTNGAIILAAKPNVAEKVMEDLRKAGYQPWILGRVGQKAAQPTVHIIGGVLPNYALADLKRYFGNFASIKQ